MSSEWTIETFADDAVYYNFIVYETDPSISNKKKTANNVEGLDKKGFLTLDHIPERNIRIFDGEIPKGHPLHYLRRRARNENKISDDLKHAIAHQKIIFDYP
jgi:hypothetical protein